MSTNFTKNIKCENFMKIHLVGITQFHADKQI
jgi:hypothetical protein